MKNECSYCEGKGSIKSIVAIECPKCNGTGSVKD
jgi:DnaJ-class molecular chaperone